MRLLQKIAFTAVTFVATGSVFAQASIPKHSPQIRWTAYRSSRLFVQVKVPAAWKMKYNNKAIGFTSPGAGPLHAGIGIMKSHYPTLTIEQRADREFRLEGKPKDWAQSYSTVGGMRAMKIVRNTKHNQRVIEYYVETPHGPYVVQCMGPRDRWNLYVPLFAQILKTVKFNS